VAAVDGFGRMQGDGGRVSQRERFNASAMAEEDAWETVNFVYGDLYLVRRFVVCLRDLYLLTNSLELVLCLEREAV
jgi:hypothetical protein